MISEARVGIISSTTGTYNPLRSTTDGALAVANAGGSLAEAALNGRLFQAANQAAVATTAGLTTTWTGLALCNPTGSGKVYIVHQFSYALTVVGPACAAVGLMTTTDSGMATSITPQCCRPGYVASTAIVDDGATIATPVLVRVFGTTSTGAITTMMLTPTTVIDLGGSIILPAGRSIATYTNAACTAALIFSFLWEEVTA